MLLRSWLAGLALALISTSAHAQEAIPPCEPQDVSEYRLVVLNRIAGKPGERVQLQERPRGCPERGSCLWRGTAYVLAGDHVFQGNDFGDFTCVHFGSASRGIVTGWLPKSRLADAEEGSRLTPATLAGHWVRSAGEREPGSLEFKVSAGGLNLRGDALYYASRTEPIDVRDALVEGSALLSGRAFLVNQDDRCIVWGVLRGPYLVVEESGGCGGLAANFTGVYRRKGR